MAQEGGSQTRSVFEVLKAKGTVEDDEIQICYKKISEITDVVMKQEKWLEPANKTW